jgi:hypothetical protein
MSTPFSSSKILLNRAKKDFEKLKGRTSVAIKKQTYDVFLEPEPDKPEFAKCKMRLESSLPDEISELTGHIVNSLRFALDMALNDVAEATGCKKPRSARNAYFPFSKDETTFEANLKGRCADVPEEMWPLLRGYRPYKGGEDLLLALNELCNANKHALVLPVGQSTFAAGVEMSGTGFMSTPYPRPVWDYAKNEMELFTIHKTATAQFNSNFEFAIEIVFGEVGGAAKMPVLPNLKRFIEVVGIILGEIETEAIRLGFTK